MFQQSDWLTRFQDCRLSTTKKSFEPCQTSLCERVGRSGNETTCPPDCGVTGHLFFRKDCLIPLKDTPKSEGLQWVLDIDDQCFNLAVLARTKDNALTLRSDFMVSEKHSACSTRNIPHAVHVHYNGTYSLLCAEPSEWVRYL